MSEKSRYRDHPKTVLALVIYKTLLAEGRLTVEDSRADKEIVRSTGGINDRDDWGVKMGKALPLLSESLLYWAHAFRTQLF
jgi:hypothetical protein